MVPRMLLLAALVIAAAPATADVYKYVDANGQIQYTDRPATLPAERLNIESRRTDTVALNDRMQAEREQAEKAEAARQSASTEAADERAAKQLTAREKAEQCIQARERYGKYATSHRLYEDLGDGQRRYLSDSEIDAARDAARRAMEELCK